MAENAPPPETSSKSSLPLIMIGAVVIFAAVAVVAMMMNQGPTIEVEKEPGEYVVTDKLYQLKDGSYLKLAFNIVVDADKIPQVTEILERQSPGRLPAGITMILGNKERDDLISGTHKREAFARELKKMLEERVFGEYNRKQTSAQNTIEVREVLISDFVTQSG